MIVVSVLEEDETEGSVELSRLPTEQGSVIVVSVLEAGKTEGSVELSRLPLSPH